MFLQPALNWEKCVILYFDEVLNRKFLEVAEIIEHSRGDHYKVKLQLHI